jgi:DNA-binding phage protein
MERVEPKSKIEHVKAETLLARFRSKEDLYRYFSQHGNPSLTLDP